jgi:hypothetical protein
MTFKTARYGWLPDLPDHRDHLYAAPVELAAAPSAKVDLRPLWPVISGQYESFSDNEFNPTKPDRRL